ncbi:MAG: cbb3-type cytochrome c oxidase subunit I [Candidatus Methanoperedens sp.]|nr:cbb3-type cytochrome c oxidase subunit I [Candidatus Methanoperedens sp.]
MSGITMIYCKKRGKKMTLGIRYLKTSLIYFIVGVTMGALLTVKPVHDFALQSPLFAGAHAHINLLGWVSMALIGGIHLHLKDKNLYSEKLGNAGFWLLNVGIAVMFILMLIAGYIWSSLSIAGKGELIDAAVGPYMILTMVFGIVIAIGAYLTAYNLLKTLCRD